MYQAIRVSIMHAADAATRGTDAFGGIDDDKLLWKPAMILSIDT